MNCALPLGRVWHLGILLPNLAVLWSCHHKKLCNPSARSVVVVVVVGGGLCDGQVWTRD